jgi:hypothetical protein
MNPPPSSPIRGAGCSIWLSEDGILHVDVDGGVAQDLATARTDIAEGARLVGSRKVPVLVDVRRVKSVSREAREHYSGDAVALFTSALAILIESPLSKMLGNFFMGFNKARFPRRLFTDEAEALSWLRGFLE